MKSDINGVAAYRSFIVKGLSRFPFVGPESDDSLGSLKMVITPIAFSPKHIFPRAVAQESAFTIHKGSLEGEESKSINDVLPSKKSLARYIIPKIIKGQIENDLDGLGINYRTLFPDLEGLAKDYKRIERYLAWGQPEPPTF